MNHNQGRTFGPLLGLFLVNLLAKLVTAKYYSYLPSLHFSYDPSPWLAYNKPLPTHNHHTSYSQWYPIKNPYENLYQPYPTLTTASPYLTDEHHQHNQGDYDYQEEYDYPINTQYANYDRLIPAESNNIQKQSSEQINRRTTIPPKKEQKHIPLEKSTTIAPMKFSTIPEKVESSTLAVTTTVTPTRTTHDPIPAESSLKVRRQPTQKYKRRSPSRRDKYPQRRRRPTTPVPEHYDSYEDYYTERYQPNRKRRPPYQQQSAESYYDDNTDEYYDYETTTRYYKKQKRRPTRKPNRNQNQNRNDDSFEIETNTERINPNTEIVIVRQAMPTTPASTTTTGSSTTTEPTTIITNTTSSTTTTASTNNTYGYGPSNGNEHVSFTYGPPVRPYSHYQVPYVDWYAHEATKNAIVKRVRDIVNIDKRLNLK